MRRGRYAVLEARRSLHRPRRRVCRDRRVLGLACCGARAASDGPTCVLCFCFGLAGGIVGRIKGSSFFIWFLISARAAGAGLLIAVAYRYERDELRRQCPSCGKIVKLHDAMCMRCGTDLEFPEVAIEPESAVAGRR